MSAPKLDDSRPPTESIQVDTVSAAMSSLRMDDGSALVEVHACGVCYMKYDDLVRVPKVLTCGHTYCLVCLKSISLQNGSSRIACPSCRKGSTCSYRMLPNNFQLLDLLSKMSLMECSRTPPLKPISENGESAAERLWNEDPSESVPSNQDTDEFEQHRNFLLGLVDTDHSDTGESDDDDTPLFGILNLERSVDSAESLIRHIEESISVDMTAEERQEMAASVVRLDGIVTDLRDLEQKFMDIREEIRNLKVNHRHLMGHIALRNDRVNGDEMDSFGEAVHEHNLRQLLLRYMRNRNDDPFRNEDDVFRFGGDYDWSSEEDVFSVGTNTIEIEENGAFMTRVNSHGNSELVCMSCDCVVPSGIRAREIHLQGRRHRAATGQLLYSNQREPHSSSFVDPNSDPNAPPIPNVPRRRGRGRGRGIHVGAHFRGRRAARPPFAPVLNEDHHYLGGGGMGGYPIW